MSVRVLMPREVWPFIYRVQVTRVIDGDTLEVYGDNGRYNYFTERVRLLGVDTPEIKGTTYAAGVAAREFVIEWVRRAREEQPGQEWPFILQTFKSDSFGRWLGYISRMYGGNGVSLNDALLSAGHATRWER